MKNIYRKPFLRWAFALTALLCCGAAQAQQLQPAPGNDPALAWKTPVQVQAALQSVLQTLQPQLADQTPGSPTHTDLLRRILYYKAILRNLQGGVTVQIAVEAGLPEAASMGGLYEQNYTPEAVLRSLYADVLALVTN